MAGDFYMNLLDFEQNKKVKNFRKRVTKNTVSAIDHTCINSVTETNFKTGIIKSIFWIIFQ